MQTLLDPRGWGWLDTCQILGMEAGMARYLFEFWFCLVSNYVYELRF